MKKLLTILLLSSFALFGQEPIYNINSNNLHLLNKASYNNLRYNINIDNSFEYYNKNNQQNSTHLNFLIKTTDKIIVGLNSEFNYINSSNKNLNFDGVIIYKMELDNFFYTYTALNIGATNYQIDYSNLQKRYDYTQSLPNNIYFNKTLFNIGASAIIGYKQHQVGFSVDHLNQAKLPVNNDKIPIKYTAFIRNGYKSHFYSSLYYSYQDEFFYNPSDINYYYDMLNYIGINLDYTDLANIGIGYKHLSNNNNVFSVNISFIIDTYNTSISLTYSPSIMQTAASKSIAQFHQISIYFKAATHRSGGLRFL